MHCYLFFLFCFCLLCWLVVVYDTCNLHRWLLKGASTLCRATEYNTLQLCRAAKVVRHMPPMRSHPHEKSFLQTFFRLQKLWNKTGEVCLIFFSNWMTPFWNPLLIICCAASFDGTDNLPIKFLGRAESKRHAAAEPTQRPHILAAWRDICCAALPHCAAWHSVDVP